MGLSHSPRIVTDGLVLCLDAANAKSYPGSGTTWTDLSGRNNNGTLTNGPTFDADNGGSVVFDGSNDFIDGPSISNQFTADITVEAWIKINTRSADWVRIAGTGTQSGGAGNRTFGLWIATTGRLLWQRYGGQDPAIYPTTPILSTNTWCHVAATTSGSSHVLYLNSLSIGTATAAGPWTASGVNITIAYAGIHTYHNGNISNVKLYTRALTAAEIQQNFNALRGRYGI